MGFCALGLGFMKKKTIEKWEWDFNKIDDSVILLFGIQVNLVSKSQHDQSVIPQTRSKRFCEFSNGPGVVVTESLRGHICAEQEQINCFYLI